MDFLSKLKDGTKKILRRDSLKNEYVFYDKDYPDDLQLSDIDGWLLTMKDDDSNYTAPFSIRIDDKYKKDVPISNDDDLKKYFDETLISKLKNMTYRTKQLEKDKNYSMLCLGCYFKFGFKIFDPLLYVSDIKFVTIQK